jgi:hypothetical protein
MPGILIGPGFCAEAGMVEAARANAKDRDCFILCEVDI